MTTIAQSVSVDYRALGPAAYALVGAMSATSYVLYTQVGLSQAGVIPLMRGTLAGKVNLSSAEKVKIWKEFYNSAKVMALGGTAAATLCDAIVATQHPSPLVRKLSIASGVVGALIVPFTYVFIMPTNNTLFAIADKHGDVDKDKQSAQPDPVNPQKDQSDDADTLIARWDSLHKVRFAMYAGALVLATCALMTDRRLVTELSETVVL